MKIAHISPYDHQVAGGVREHVVNLAAQHRALGHSVAIIAPASSPQRLAQDVVCASTRVVPIPGAGSIARISLSPDAFRRVGRILAQRRFDVVHIHEPLMPMVSFSALYQAKTVTVGTIHHLPELVSLRSAAYRIGPAGAGPPGTGSWIAPACRRYERVRVGVG